MLASLLIGIEEIDQEIILNLTNIHDITNLYHTSKLFQQFFEQKQITRLIKDHFNYRCDVDSFVEFINSRRLDHDFEKLGKFVLSSKALKYNKMSIFRKIVEKPWTKADGEIKKYLTINRYRSGRLRFGCHAWSVFLGPQFTYHNDSDKNLLKSYFIATYNLDAIKLMMDLYPIEAVNSSFGVAYRTCPHSFFVTNINDEIYDILETTVKYPNLDIFDYIASVYPQIYEQEYLIRILIENCINIPSPKYEFLTYLIKNYPQIDKIYSLIEDYIVTTSNFSIIDKISDINYAVLADTALRGNHFGLLHYILKKLDYSHSNHIDILNLIVIKYNNCKTDGGRSRLYPIATFALNKLKQIQPDKSNRLIIITEGKMRGRIKHNPNNYKHNLQYNNLKKINNKKLTHNIHQPSCRYAKTRK
jgi:hypothetical protein